jgi:hypothetical protein
MYEGQNGIFQYATLRYFHKTVTPEVQQQKTTPKIEGTLDNARYSGTKKLQ